MSSIFKTPKVRNIAPRQVDPMIVDRSEFYYDLEIKRQRKRGAVSQLLSHDNTYGVNIAKKNVLG